VSDDEDIFGARPDQAPAEDVPFPRMRPNPTVRERWAAEVERRNAASKTRHVFQSPLDAVPSLLEKRKMPSMPWPAYWPEIARRCRLYVGESLGITGGIAGGKTAFALQLAISGTAAGHPVIWDPVELDNEQVDLRAIATMHGAALVSVREQWSEERIRHALTAISDLWHYVDQYDDIDQHFEALEACIEISWRVYRVPPVVVIDHLGELVAEERDDRAALRKLAKRFRKLFLRTNSYGVLLNQVSKSNQAVTSGRVELESAADAMAIEMASQAIASAVSNSIVLLAFKADDSPVVDGQALIPKARNTGKVGRVGMRFHAEGGGTWAELAHLPPTPASVKAQQAKDKKDAHRIVQRTEAEVRADLNEVAEDNARVRMRARMLDEIRRYGAMGIEVHELRKVPGVGRGAMFQVNLQELERTLLAERYGTKMRATARME
jgi:KaiC/GvpD/RAD55 family RecA-like ATPase